MKNLYFAVLAILMCCATGYSQDDEYLKLENERITKGREVEKDIEKFISKNLKKYTLNPDMESGIRKSFAEESRIHGEIISEEEIQEALTDAKKEELRKLYFKNNPKKVAVMKGTPSKSSSKEGYEVYTVPADCFNGDFEQGLTGYFFSRMRPINIDSPGEGATGFDILNCEISTDPLHDLDPGFALFTPSQNNFNTEGGSLMTTPNVFDPNLQAVGVQISTIHSGGGAIKLNRSTGSTDITTMKKRVIPTSNSIGFHFSLIVNNPHAPTPNGPDGKDQPFFTVRVYRDRNNNASLEPVIIDEERVNTNNICITADINNTIFTPVDANRLLYTGWVCDKINIPDNLVGTDLIIEFIITDCGQTGHFGTVYIDDICDVCERPAFGSIEMDDAGFNCPTAPFQVCGTLTMPNENDGNPNAVTLQIEDSNGNVVQSYTNAVISNPNGSLFERRFCFTVDPSVYTAGDYTFVAIANFGTHTVSDFGATGNVDLSFNSNGTVLNSYVVRNELYWDGTEESYDLEFIVDSVCCPDNEVIDPIPAYYATTVTENHINIYNITSHLQFECFRWRVKTSCGWSEWCCITTSQGNDFPSDAYWGNVYEPGCYDSTIDLCEPFLEEYDNVAANASQFEQREQYIKAYNTINNNARVTYQAGDYVELELGFNAVASSVFTARIEECIPQTVFTTVANKSRVGEPDIISVTQSEQLDNGFKVYPNPTAEIVSIASGLQVKVYVVTDITGKELMRVNAEKGETIINLSHLESGIYMLTADGKLIQKIIKK